MSKQVILTGLRANNDLTLGNYFGAILPMVDMARTRVDEFQINMFIPDLHSFTTPVNHAQLQAGIWNNLRIFLASGLPIHEPDIYLYRQSYIPAHSELAWILECFTGFGEMGRMTQFKDKSAKLEANRVSLGLFNYPVLMASDILLYGATYIPVGDDQTQHLEFTRDIAERMNNTFNQELFVVPKPVNEQHAFFGKDQGLRIMDLQEPTKKMSKSDDTGKGVIFLNDLPDVAAQKIMSATTDSVGVITLDHKKQPGIANLMEIYALLTGRNLQEIADDWQGKTSYGEFKATVAEAVKLFLSDLQSKISVVSDAQIQQKLEYSEERMLKKAQETLHRVQKAVGLRG